MKIINLFKKNTKIKIKKFDFKAYLESNSDIQTAISEGLFKNAEEHFKRFGFKEIQKGLRPFHPHCKNYDEEDYLNTFPSVKEAIQQGKYSSGFEHFCAYGYSELLQRNHLSRHKMRNQINSKQPSVEGNHKKYMRLLLKSPFWDEKYYLKKNPDVKESNTNPLEHYILYGYKEFRNPSKLFNTEYYLSTYPDVKQANMNPLVHYLKYGEQEGREILPKKESSPTNISTLITYLDANKEIPKIITTNPIDIIIPVYNGYEYLSPLFNSIFNNTTAPYRLLVCDDKSPDENVYRFLSKIQKENQDVAFELYQNEENLGFVGTVNRMVQHTQNHFVLLNTDTEVPKYWIERLMYPIFSMQKIATTTPFTNSGTICSFPNYLEDNPIYENLSVDALDEYFKKINFSNTYIDIPTGVGFCMGVNKELVDKIGMFDTIFGKGYGEENDLCQRAIKEGYQNLHVPNLFVYHKHGGSFPSETKQRLIESNYKLLLEKHSTYEEQVQACVKKDALKDLREFMEAIIQCDMQYSCLIIDHALGGGANHYTDEKIDERLNKGQVVFLLQYDYRETKKYIGTLYFQRKEMQLYAENSTILHEFLMYFCFDEIFINSLVSFPDVEHFIDFIQTLSTSYDAKLIIPIHDYFPLCPNYTLLNHDNRYCEIPSPNSTACRECLIQSNGDFKQFSFIPDIQRWRNSWSTLLSRADEILCFSYASEKIFHKTYPTFKSKTKVIYHDISGRYEVIYDDTYKSKKRIIGILGGINVPKGALVIKNMVKYIEDNKLDIKIVLIGELSEPLKSKKFHMTGRYNVDELPKIVKKLEITEFLIPSVWPETFSYTTDEIMQLGYPLTVFDIGAPAERVKHYARGNVIAFDKWKNFIKGEK